MPASARHPEEIRILEELSAQFGRVSNERLICGPGLVNLHRALSRIAGEDPGLLQRPMSPRAPAAGDPRGIARRGSVLLGVRRDRRRPGAGPWAHGMVCFLTGGLVPRMLDSLHHSGFRQRFEHKGRFSAAMAGVPTLAVLHPHAGLLGAAACAVDAGIAVERRAPNGFSRADLDRIALQEYPDAEHWADAVAREMRQILAYELEQHGQARLLLSGGTTPAPGLPCPGRGMRWTGRGWKWGWWTNAGCRRRIATATRGWCAEKLLEPITTGTKASPASNPWCGPAPI